MDRETRKTSRTPLPLDALTQSPFAARKSYSRRLPAAGISVIVIGRDNQSASNGYDVGVGREYLGLDRGGGGARDGGAVRSARAARQAAKAGGRGACLGPIADALIAIRYMIL